MIILLQLLHSILNNYDTKFFFNFKFELDWAEGFWPESIEYHNAHHDKKIWILVSR